MSQESLAVRQSSPRAEVRRKDRTCNAQDAFCATRDSLREE
jgi:hypothetical protein